MSITGITPGLAPAFEAALLPDTEPGSGSTAYIHPLPTTPSASAPADFTSKRAGTRGGLHPSAMHVRIAPAVATEIRTASKAYSADLGKTAPPPKELADLIVLATGWYQEDRRARTYAAYCREQSRLVWAVLFERLGVVAVLFAAAVARDPEVATRFGALGALLAVRSASARKGSSTRKANEIVAPRASRATTTKLARARKRKAEIDEQASVVNAGVRRLEGAAKSELEEVMR